MTIRQELEIMHFYINVKEVRNIWRIKVIC